MRDPPPPPDSSGVKRATEERERFGRDDAGKLRKDIQGGGAQQGQEAQRRLELFNALQKSKRSRTEPAGASIDDDNPNLRRCHPPRPECQRRR
eukprot:6015717-Pyramimonas_sp.AAC.1